MKKIHIIVLTILITTLTSFNYKREFPTINYQTIDGKNITNDFFKGKKTIVILGHLGCPAAMLLLEDLNSFEPEPFQILIFLENTHEQVMDFNSSEKNNWSSLRNYFKVQPITQNVIAECETENIERIGDDIIVGQQCRGLSKKIKTKTSPTIVYVDETGSIYKKLKGYYGDMNQIDRVKKLLNDN